MAKPNGSSKTGGRKKGTPNKVSTALQEAAQAYTPAALETLRKICVDGESEAARVAAANSLLDRGYGKPTAHVTGDLTHNPLMVHSKPSRRPSLGSNGCWRTHDLPLIKNQRKSSNDPRRKTRWVWQAQRCPQ
jgi:hypothetical protein